MKKKAILTASVLVFVAAAIIGTISIINHRQERRQERMQEELRMAFRIQNRIFQGIAHVDNDSPTRWLDRERYVPINLRTPHIDGISYGTYISLINFRKETGIELTYEMVIDYLSQEFEDDGEIRIFTNGRHPEIASYIEWANDARNDQIRRDWGDRIANLYWGYTWDNQPLPRTDPSFLPIEMIDELINKAIDPDYEMDLTSIQERYLAEGRAEVVSPTQGIPEIRFIVPES